MKKQSPLLGKISSACKSAAKRKFKVWRCTKAGGPGKIGKKKK